MYLQMVDCEYKIWHDTYRIGETESSAPSERDRAEDKEPEDILVKSHKVINALHCFSCKIKLMRDLMKGVRQITQTE